MDVAYHYGLHDLTLTPRMAVSRVIGRIAM